MVQAQTTPIPQWFSMYKPHIRQPTGLVWKKCFLAVLPVINLVHEETIVALNYGAKALQPPCLCIYFLNFRILFGPPTKKLEFIFKGVVS
jgi:hypothetical protein